MSPSVIIQYIQHESSLFFEPERTVRQVAVDVDKILSESNGCYYINADKVLRPSKFMSFI
jgi:hypothetical protein